MKTFLHIIIGFVAGVLCTLLVLFLLAVDHQENTKVPYSSFNVKTNKGTVKLHTGMPRDSVYFLLGNPDSFQTTTIKGHNVEIAGFRVSNNLVPDINITFEDGVLTDFRKI